MKFGEKIKSLREMHSLTQGQVAYKLGVTTGTIAHWELGRRTPNYETLNNIAELFDVTVDYLIGNTNVINGTVITNIKAMQRKVQVLGRIPAGVPFESIEDIIDDIEVPSFLERRKELFGLIIKGDSMSKIIPDGNIAIFEKTSRLENGEVGAIMVNGYDATVKKFYKLTDSILLEPVSYSDEYTPTIIKDGVENVTIIGRYLWNCSTPLK